MRRLASIVPTVLGVVVLVFAFLHAVPGDRRDHARRVRERPRRRVREPGSIGCRRSSPVSRRGRTGRRLDRVSRRSRP
jgi:ABC-type dipeptide/oligopeptide/nickel transport system permease component